MSYATFDNWVAKTANLLSEEFNVQRGSRVAIAVGEHWAGTVTAFACWRAGACAVPVPREQTARLDEVLAAARPDVAVVHEDLAEGLSGPAVAVGGGFGGRVTKGVGGAVPYGDEVPAFADDFDDHEVTLDDPALLVLPPWSGRQAAIVLDQTSLLAAALALGDWGELGDDDRMLAADPADPVEGLVLGQLGPFAAGAACVAARNLDPATFARKVRDERVTWTLPSPALLEQLPSKSADLGALRGFLSPSGAPAAVADQVEAATGRHVHAGSGVAAATGAATLEPVGLDDDTRRWLAELDGRYAGAPTAWAEVTVLDAEVCVRGPLVMAGHDGREDLDDAAFGGGWLHTGLAGQLAEGPDGRSHLLLS